MFRLVFSLSFILSKVRLTPSSNYIFIVIGEAEKSICTALNTKCKTLSAIEILEQIHLICIPNQFLIVDISLLDSHSLVLSTMVTFLWHIIFIYISPLIGNGY